jgi:purine-nucleoside phosphorylase
MLSRIHEAVSFLESRSQHKPAVGLVLGSGLGSVVDAIKADISIPYSEIPHAPVSSVVGHSGKFVIGHVGDVPVAVMQGRVHYYEGYTMDEVLFLPRVLARLGARKMIVTNAAGGVNTDFDAGDLMLISDHVNLFGVNPLRGANIDELGVRFPDLSDAYSSRLRKIAHEIAKEQGIDLKEGVYFGLSGPTYETPAEIRMYRLLGADAIGMSTVPEVIAFNHMGVEVIGISCITNMAAGVLQQKLTHTEVMETTARVQQTFTSYIVNLVPAIAQA